jgi:CheY-like chemotaxis protein
MRTCVPSIVAIIDARYRRARAMTASVTAIAVAPNGVTGALLAMIERLQTAGVLMHVADDLGGAAEIASRIAVGPPAILLDLQYLVAGAEIEDLHSAAERIRRAAHAIPHTTPIAVTGAADAAIVVTCIRAGAGDLIDIQLEGTATARAVVQRIYQRQVERAHEANTARTLRSMIEDLLKDLIRTERRSIDLEEKVAHFESVTGEARELGDQRPPAILLVERERAIADQLAERLESAGVSTFAYTSGEDAIRDVDTMLGAGTGFDLSLVAVQLPGIDGLETVRRLRERIPGLPAFLMTAATDADLAARAADLGVVGFVQKPLPAVEEVVGRLAQLARESLERTREQLYLARIKARHERVLARYRSLPREP